MVDIRLIPTRAADKSESQCPANRRNRFSDLQKKKTKAGWRTNQPSSCMAEREGFEPSVEFNPHTRLAGEHHRPTRSSLQRILFVLAEGVGFEPTVLSHNGFQDRRLKPLGHPSRERVNTISQEDCQQPHQSAQ